MDNKNSEPFRWQLIKKAAVFQLKLGLDALRDILLSPLSLMLVLIDIALGHNQQQSYFIKLMKFGRLSDRWINLFETKAGYWDQRNKSVDYWLAQVATVVKDQQTSGKMSDAAKAKIDGYMAQINKKLDKKDRSPAILEDNKDTTPTSASASAETTKVDNEQT
ncbi:MAG: hypothetical protein HRT35_12240 [Algicola sp.]|nr:hypothetical protein [Algicola sp.]